MLKVKIKLLCYFLSFPKILEIISPPPPPAHMSELEGTRTPNGAVLFGEVNPHAPALYTYQPACRPPHLNRPPSPQTAEQIMFS